MAIMGTTLAVAGDLRPGHGEQIGEWVPQCYGTPSEPKVGAFCVSEPDAGSDVSSLRTRARYDEANGRVGPQRPEGVGHQRRHRQRARDRRLGRPRARLARPGRVRDPAGHAGPGAWARRSRSTACAPRTPPTSSSTTAASPAACLLGGKEKLDERLARAREGTRGARQAAMQTFEATRPTVGAQALGIARAAYEYALDYAQGARAVRPPDHREPGDRVHARRHEDGDRRRAAARLARVVDGPHRARRSRTPRAR